MNNCLKLHILLLSLVLLTVAAPAQIYTSSSQSYGGATTTGYTPAATMPRATFQSTSSSIIRRSSAVQSSGLSGRVANPTLSVDGQATISDLSGIKAPRRAMMSDDDDDDTNIPTPGDDPQDPPALPVGDGLWLMLLLVMVYLTHRRLHKPTADV